MDFEQRKRLDNESYEESISIREILERYLIHVKWFIASIILCVFFALIKFYFEVPQYEISASLLIKDKENGNSFADLSGFEDLGLIGLGSERSLQNEIEILKSRSLMKSVVRELKLNTQYFVENFPSNIEQYPNFPVTVSIESDSRSNENISSSFELLLISKDKFEYIDFSKNSIGDKRFGEVFKADLGNEDMSDIHEITIALNENFDNKLIGKKIIIQINSIEATANNYIERLVIEPIDERFSNVLTLSMSETVIEKGKAIINNLILQYNADGIKDKNEISQSTTDFLDLRIGLISAELAAIEGTAEQFKSKNQMIDSDAGTNIFLETSSANESQMVTANTQVQLVDYMLEELEKGNDFDLLPGNIGLSNSSIIDMVSEFNDLVLQRNRVLKSSSVRNPIIVGIDSQLVILKNNLSNNLNSLKSSLQIEISALSKQSGRINSRIASVPRNERELKDIVRQQETKNALYLFLLQKREESVLSNAVSVDKSKVINEAYANPSPVSPKRIIFILAGIVLGVLVPFIIIYIKDLLDTKVHDEKDIRKLKIPFIGDVPFASNSKQLYVGDGDDSNIAEAFRYIRTNINFMLDDRNEGRVIFVTSTKSYEGKTFSAINLARSLAISGKNTLLIGMDLRAPKFKKYLNLKNRPGVTNFIKNDMLTLGDITERDVTMANLDLINSGDIPPNPVELLMSKRVNEIFEIVRSRYEYIVVDTAPVGMVTDTIQISKHADLSIYVIKANFLDKRLLHIPEKLQKENKLTNMAILINGINQSKGAYGYGYGYGKIKEKPWYKFSHKFKFL